MQLVEKHIIKRGNHMYSTCDALCFASKNIYNRSLYLIKTEYEETKTYKVYNDMFNYLKNEDCYKQLPPKVATATLRLVHGVVKGFFGMLKSDKVDNKNVEFPHYLHKTKGRYIVSYNNQAISKKVFEKAHKVKLSQCDIEVPTKVENFSQINCVNITPGLEQYTISIVYTVEDVEQLPSNRTYAAIDLGVSNLATVTFSMKGVRPFIVNGRPLKSMNHYYNKKLSEMKNTLEKVNNKKTSHKLKILTNKRNNKVNDYLHKASKYIVKQLVDKKVTKLIIGKNTEWKQNCNIGKVNNQNFVQIPHSRFIDLLVYKCERCGIAVQLQEESYTSKCSFIDLESMEHHDSYLGRRKKRGLFVSKDKKKINADVNGSYNIMRKAVPSVFNHGIQGFVVNPVIITN